MRCIGTGERIGDRQPRPRPMRKQLDRLAGIERDFIGARHRKSHAVATAHRCLLAVHVRTAVDVIAIVVEELVIDVDEFGTIAKAGQPFERADLAHGGRKLRRRHRRQPDPYDWLVGGPQLSEERIQSRRIGLVPFIGARLQHIAVDGDVLSVVHPDHDHRNVEATVLDLLADGLVPVEGLDFGKAGTRDLLLQDRNVGVVGIESLDAIANFNRDRVAKNGDAGRRVGFGDNNRRWRLLRSRHPPLGWRRLLLLLLQLLLLVEGALTRPEQHIEQGPAMRRLLLLLLLLFQGRIEGLCQHHAGCDFAHREQNHHQHEQNPAHLFP